MGTSSSKALSGPSVEKVLDSEEQLFYYRNMAISDACSAKISYFKQWNKLVDVRANVDPRVADEFQSYHEPYLNTEGLTSEEKRKRSIIYNRLRDKILSATCVLCNMFPNYEKPLRECMGDELVEWSLMQRKFDQEGEEQYDNLNVLKLDYDRVASCFQNEQISAGAAEIARHHSFLTTKGSLKGLFPSIVHDLSKQSDSQEKMEYVAKNSEHENHFILDHISKQYANNEMSILNSCLNGQSQFHPGCFGEVVLYSNKLAQKFCRTAMRNCLENKLPSYIVGGLEDSEAWDSLSVEDYSQCLYFSKGGECNACLDTVMQYINETSLKE